MRKIIIPALIAALTLGLFAQETSAGNSARSPHAVTVWWVVFNNPENCNFNPTGEEKCGPADVFGQPYLDSVANGTPNPDLIAPNVAAGLAVVYGTGNKTTGGGRVDLIGSMVRTPEAVSFGANSIVDPMGLGRALDNPNAEIHFVIRDHGDIVPEGLDAQIQNFLDPYCSDPNLGYIGGENLCADVQFAIFAAGQQGSKPVIAFGGGAVDGASAKLIRNGDMVQFIISTRIDTNQ